MKTEYEEQVSVFDWAKRNEKRHPELRLLFGSLMGCHLPLRALNKYKKAGMKSGKPDIQLPIAKGQYCGLWIELKRRKGGKVSLIQDEMLRLLADYGNDVYVCKGADSAIKAIKGYLLHE